MSGEVSEIGRGYWIAAHSYLSAIRKLVDAADNDEGIVLSVLPINFLAGFCLELQFKAWLALKGWEEKRIIGLRHRVGQAFEAACAEGLPAISDLESFVNILKAGHESYDFRYLNAGVDFGVWGDDRWEWGFNILRELDDEVQQLLKQSLEHSQSSP